MTNNILKHIVSSLVLVFFFSCSFEKPSTYSVEPGWYVVTSKKQVSCYNAKKTGGWDGGGRYLHNGNKHYVTGDAEIHNGEMYVKIKVASGNYYTKLKHLKFYATELPDNKEYIGESPFEYTDPTAYLLYVIIALVLAYLFADVGWFGDLLIKIALPIILVIYLYNGPAYPLWMCHPTKVGLPVAIFSYLCIVAVATMLFYIAISSIKGIFLIFKKPLYAIISLISLILNAYAAIGLLGQFLIEDLLAAFVGLLILAPTSSKYLGLYKDKDGELWDVYLD